MSKEVFLILMSSVVLVGLLLLYVFLTNRDFPPSLRSEVVAFYSLLFYSYLQFSCLNESVLAV